MICSSQVSFTKISINLSFVFISDAEQGRSQEIGGSSTKNSNVNFGNSQSIRIICGTFESYLMSSI